MPSKKPDLNTKAGRYYLELKKGRTKVQAQALAGYKGTNSVQVERSKAFQDIKRYFNDELLDRITTGEIADELVKNIKQDNKLEAKNTAIKIALDRLEPANAINGDDEDRVMVIISNPK
jgi:hypothetical protein